jgi:hydrogenase maturation protease
VYVIEPDLAALNTDGGAGILDGHGMNPLNVLRLAGSLGGTLSGIMLVGCEPETFGPEEGLMGLSATVEGAVDEAVRVVESLIERFSESRTNPVSARIPN